jgi:hypothetical protein
MKKHESQRIDALFGWDSLVIPAYSLVGYSLIGASLLKGQC